MKIATIVAIILLVSSSASAADTAPPVDAPHKLVLKDSDLDVLAFMVQRIGARCDSSDEGLKFCLAQIRGKQLVDSINAQLKTLEK